MIASVTIESPRQGPVVAAVVSFSTGARSMPLLDTVERTN
jgi:hypothetical protein